MNMASGSGSSGSWSFEQMKIVETALVDYTEDDPDRWEKIAALVGGGKTAEDVKKYYDDLVEDVENIMAGKVELPKYNDGDTEAEETMEIESEGSTKTDEGPATSHK